MSLFNRLRTTPSIRRHGGRFKEIVSVLARYGVSGWVHEGHPEFVRDRLKGKDSESLAGLSAPVRWRMALAELGPTFIKLGQMLATRSDLVGPEMAAELEKLQSDTPADAHDIVTRTITEELGKPPDALFDGFEPEALASASIGQVHTATLADGRPVVVKVQHAGIEDVVRKDLDILATMAELAERHDEELRLYQPARMVAEFQRSLLRELDYGREADNLVAFAGNFSGWEKVHFPEVHVDLSSRRVLTMERMSGISLKDPSALEAEGYDTTEVARTGADAWIQMILKDGFFHADPHPGNLLVLEGGRLGILDCGMVGRLDDHLRRDFEAFVLAILQQDGEELTEVVLEMCTAPPEFDRDAFRAEMVDFCGDYLGISMDRLDAQAALNEAMAITRRHRLMLPSGLAQLLRTLALLDGTSRRLTRTFNVLELLKPWAQRIAASRLSPKSVAKEALKRARVWDRLLESAPGDVRDILARLRQGTFDVNLRHRDLDTVVNRLVKGVLAAALLLGSTLLLSQRVPPLTGDVSLFGVLGALGAVGLGIHLLREMRRSGGER